MSASTARRGPQGGPPPLAPALAYGALLIASVAVWIGAPQAGASAASTLSYAQAHTGQMHVEAVLVFGAAVPLAIWAATVYRRLRTLGVTAPGAVIGLAGGILAAASLAVSGLVTLGRGRHRAHRQPGAGQGPVRPVLRGRRGRLRGAVRAAAGRVRRAGAAPARDPEGAAVV